MSDPYFQQLFADRIGGIHYGKDTEIYKFEKIKRAKRQAMADRPDRKLLDFGIGENDNIAAQSVRQVMGEEIHLLENRGYADNGVPEFKAAVARFMQREFDVRLDPDSEINHCIGSKTALSMIPTCFINPGDITLMTVPGYPVAGTHTKYYGGEVHELPLLVENDFLPDLQSIPVDILQRAKLLVINYPNSPTGKLATAAFYAEVVEFAKQHQIVVVQDAAHIMLTFTGKPTSFLETPGARDVGIEIHSMSKGFDMIGWRIGWVCGNPLLVRAFADVKDNCDSGQFIAIQKAAAAALDDETIPSSVREKYRRRMTNLVTALSTCGFQCSMPGGSYFLYTSSPTGVENGPSFANAEEACQYLITEHGIVTVPWDNAGSYLRFSVTYVADGEEAEQALLQETLERLGNIPFTF
ncbi:MAG: LL-diaminopimelate aminotransferase [Planctomycetaceae bacterium]|jgi:LL-diaminopimelate aminotransferase|nr:LL-diaminopimelate aminotransferase [Planctomycetaceae bacterium]